MATVHGDTLGYSLVLPSAPWRTAQPDPKGWLLFCSLSYVVGLVGVGGCASWSQAPAPGFVEWELQTRVRMSCVFALVL